jgi:hypothetical protein
MSHHNVRSSATHDGEQTNDTAIKLSIIMPVFNEERTIAQSLESALFQRADFAFEVIVVDDCSTDRTPQIVEKLIPHFPRLRLVRSERNLGKGSSVMRAYDLARGTYFHILDGDDFFVSWEKIQKQVEFLENNNDFFAIAHNTAILHDSGEYSFVRNALQPKSFEYEACINSGFYCHTSSYMFRKIGDRLPDYFRENAMRGDTALFFYHAFNSKTKVRYVPDIASVYNFHGAGLWSRLSKEDRDRLNLDVLETLRDRVVNDPSTLEHACLESHITYAKNDMTQTAVGRPKTHSLDDLLIYCTKAAGRVFEAKISDVAFRGMYSMPLVDQLCELAGRTVIFKKNYVLANRSFDGSRIAILVSGFVPNGGGIFREIKELIAIFLAGGFAIDIYSSGKIATDPSVIRNHFDHPKISYWEVNSGDTPSAQLEALIDVLHEAAPSRIYPFITHHDAVLSATLQRGLGGEIILDYVYDHGLSLAIHNTSIDKFIVKTESQARALAPAVDSKKFLLVPPFIADKYGCNPYKPLRNVSLTTASAAARSYKVENEYTYSYFRIIPGILKRTGGLHYHYGPLKDESKALMLEELKRENIEASRFIHVPWADDFGGSLLENGVDLFLSPFPVCSARIAVEVMSCGIPSINHNLAKPTLPQAIDFVDPNQWTWNTPADLFKTIRNLDVSSLSEKSSSARQFFLANNDVKVASAHLLKATGQELTLSEAPDFVISDIVDAGLIKLDMALFGSVPVQSSNANQPPNTNQSSNANQQSSANSPSFWRRTRPVRRKIKALWTSISEPKRQIPIRKDR